MCSSDLGHKWENKYIRELELEHDRLIVMVQRNDSDIVVPSGDILLLEDDKIVILNMEHESEKPSE